MNDIAVYNNLAVVAAGTEGIRRHYLTGFSNEIEIDVAFSEIMGYTTKMIVHNDMVIVLDTAQEKIQLFDNSIYKSEEANQVDQFVILNESYSLQIYGIIQLISL